MKIALASAPVKTGDIEFNIDSMIAAMGAACGKADVIVFGKSVLQGFDSLCWEYEKDMLMAVSLTDAPIQRVCEAARDNGIAVSFGFIERGEGVLYSSQIFIGADGEIVNVFHRVSIGWKEYTRTDDHYREGDHFERFAYKGKTVAVGLCGDLWTDGRPEAMTALNADIVLWPVWCDYAAAEWNTTTKHEYAEQAALCGKRVLLVNPFCADEDAAECAVGADVYFEDGKIIAEHPAGSPGMLIVEV